MNFTSFKKKNVNTLEIKHKTYWLKIYTSSNICLCVCVCVCKMRLFESVTDNTVQVLMIQQPVLPSISAASVINVVPTNKWEFYYFFVLVSFYFLFIFKKSLIIHLHTHIILTKCLPRNIWRHRQHGNNFWISGKGTFRWHLISQIISLQHNLLKKT